MGLEVRTERLDAYTERTREWLERRYEDTADDGTYCAHQPIYGFRAGYSEPWVYERYMRTLAVLRALACFDLERVLDVGAGEGYQAALVRDLFGVHVTASDLAANAVRRAAEIYGLPGVQADVQALPFEDEAFDLVLCSETLEHVADMRRAARELVRVARGAVVITVPNEPAEWAEHARDTQEPHGHINAFNEHSFDFVAGAGQLAVSRIVSRPLGMLSALVEGTTKWPSGSRPKQQLIAWYNVVAPACGRVFGRRTQTALMALDSPACAVLRSHRAWMFVLVKDPRARRSGRSRRVRSREVLDYAVPFHRLS
jgi:ubiquinone/menaquinone biosynthesis C-methylase UbiE